MNYWWRLVYGDGSETQEPAGHASILLSKPLPERLEVFGEDGKNVANIGLDASWKPIFYRMYRYTTGLHATVFGRFRDGELHLWQATDDGITFAEPWAIDEAMVKHQAS